MLLRPYVTNGIRIEAEFSDFLPRPAVVIRVHRVRQQEFCFALRSVALDRDNHGGSNEDAVFFLFGNNQAALLDPKALAQACGNDNRTPLSDPRRLLCSH